MRNAVGREIPDEILRATGKEVFAGSYAHDDRGYQKAAPKAHGVCDPHRSKLVPGIREVLERCGIRDGMTLSFHHHFREGDYVLNRVMEEVHSMGVRNITLCATSLGKANDPIVPLIEDGTITKIYSSGVRGSIGEAISTGKLRELAVMYSHGGRWLRRWRSCPDRRWHLLRTRSPHPSWRYWQECWETAPACP